MDKEEREKRKREVRLSIELEKSARNALDDLIDAGIAELVRLGELDELADLEDDE